MATATANPGSELSLIKTGVIDVVGQKIREYQESKQLLLPANYSVENAMKSAWLILQTTVDRDKRPALQVCTRNSVANALLDMAVQGLNPAKKQGYFIVYGDQLTFQRSYFGTMAVTKEVAGAKDIYAEVVYKGDEFEYDLARGSKRILKHVQRLENIAPANIVAAYAVIVFGDDRPDYVEIMTMDQIREAWKKSRNNANADNSVHKQFPDQMAMRTVINRACKRYINTSNDDHLFKSHFNRADEEAAEDDFAEEVAESANAEIIDVGPVVAEEDPEAEESSPEPQPKEEPAKATPTSPQPAKAAPKQARLPVNEDEPDYA